MFIELLFGLLLVISIIGAIHPESKYRETKILEIIVFVIFGFAQAFALSVGLWGLLEIHRASIEAFKK